MEFKLLPNYAYPLAISKLLISFFIFHISTFLSEDVSSEEYDDDILFEFTEVIRTARNEKWAKLHSLSNLN